LSRFPTSGFPNLTKCSGIDSLNNIDWEQIPALVENGTVGKIMEVETADGDTMEIVVK